MPRPPVRLLPDHTHDSSWDAVPHCPACITLHLVNPDTGSKWARLDDHGEQVVQDSKDVFDNRYDGTNHEAALEQAATEAYLRGRMRGRIEERKESARSSDACLRNAADHLEKALAAARRGDVRSAASHTSLADWHTRSASTYQDAAGSEQAGQWVPEPTPDTAPAADLAPAEAGK